MKGSGPLAAMPSSSNTSIQHGLAVAIRDDIRGLITASTITGIVTDSVQERYVPTLRDFVIASPSAGQFLFPGILVVHPRSNDSSEQRNNLQDELSFPILIAIAAPTGQDLAANDHVWFGWREVIIRQYRTKGYTISSPTTYFHRCKVEPGPVIDWDRWAKDGQFNTWFILRFYTLQQRPQS